MATVLIADSHADLRLLTRVLAERAGHRVIECATGTEAMQRLFTDRPDAVVLDAELQSPSGWDVLVRMRQISTVPVLMTSADRGELTCTRALLDGADDFVAKPFAGGELAARLVALLRRSALASRAAEPILDDGFVRIDVIRHQVTADDVELTLTPLEVRLLTTFVRHAGHALTHAQLLEHAWGETLHGTRDQVKVAVGVLRRKLDAQAGLGPAIVSVRGIGYRWRPSRAATPLALAAA